MLVVKPGTHVGLVTGPAGGGRCSSIEGNIYVYGTNADHVDGVFPNSRAIESCYYVRP